MAQEIMESGTGSTLLTNKKKEKRTGNTQVRRKSSIYMAIFP